MAKRRGNLELSWQPKLKQWYRKRTGKQYWLGTGKGISDRQSYRKALAKWRTVEAALDLQDEEQQREKRHEQAIEQLRDLMHNDLLPDPYRKDAAQMFANHRPFRVLDPQYKTGRPSTIKGTRTTISELFAFFLRDQRKRVDHGKQFPDAPQSERLSEASYTAFYQTQPTIKNAVGVIPFDKNNFVPTIKQFRKKLQDRLVAGEIKPGTFNFRIRVFRSFVFWLAENQYLDDVPTNGAKLFSLYQVKPSAKLVDSSTVKLLWTTADDKLKTFIALALNCGFYASCISTLDGSMILGDYIVRQREKTGVPTKHKMWPITKQLIKTTRTNADGIIFLTSNGKPYAYSHDGGRVDLIAQSFRVLCKKVGVKGVSFSHLRDTSATHVEQIDPTLTSQFLGHTDKRMAKYYIDHGKLDTSRLDAAIDQLEQIYGLTL